VKYFGCGRIEIDNRGPVVNYILVIFNDIYSKIYNKEFGAKLSNRSGTGILIFKNMRKMINNFTISHNFASLVFNKQVLKNHITTLAIASSGLVLFHTSSLTRFTESE
jgi:hypothetical protein